MAKKIKCFIAMAFGREDTDLLYDNVIRPALEGDLNMRAIRVDREDYLDYVDRYILKQIEECDFILADLTYARPSVYYEAGYGERNLPVIYTCRKDHFGIDVNDTEGNRKVHFDVDKKPIIPWTEKSHKTFRTKLLRRIRKVIKPIVKENEKKYVEAEEKRIFNSLSTIEQLNLLKEVSVDVFLKKKFNKKQVDKYSKHYDPYTKTFNKTLFVVYPVVAESFKPDSPEILLYQIYPRNDKYIKEIGKKLKVNKIEEHIYMISIRRSNFETFRKRLPHARIGKEDNELYFSKEPSLHRYHHTYTMVEDILKDLTVDWTTHLHFLSGIKLPDLLVKKLNISVQELLSQ